MKASLLLALLLAGCATSTAPLTSLGPSLDDTKVSIEGKLYTLQTPYNNYHLCPDSSAADTYKKCVDLVVPSHMQSSLPKEPGSCMIFSGKFLAFGSERVGLGWFLSDIGYIDVNRASSCSGR